MQGPDRQTPFHPLMGVSVLCLVGAAAVLGGCSKSQEKLSDGGPMDGLIHSVFGQKRETSYYYQIVRDSHDQERFCYQCTQDPFLVDKNIDAVTQLGAASFARLEGQALVVSKLTEVLLEDPSALAQANAATSLTKLGLKLPKYPQTGPKEEGARFVQLLRELDSLYDASACRVGGDANKVRAAQLVDELGNFRIDDLVLAKESVRPFTNRPYLIDEADPRVRRAIDTALTKRMYALIRVALDAAVPASSPWVRADAIRGLKALVVRTSEETVLRQLEVETKPAVRAESVEYLGQIGGPRAVSALLPMIDDADGDIRYKARQALVSIAGASYGLRRRAWVRWANRTYASIDEEGVYTEPEVVEMGPTTVYPTRQLPYPAPAPDVGSRRAAPSPAPTSAPRPGPPPPPPAPQTMSPQPMSPQPMSPRAVASPMQPLSLDPVSRGAPVRSPTYSGSRPPPPPMPPPMPRR